MKTLSRLEAYLKALLNGETVDLEPMSRVEVYLKQLCEKLAKGGSGGGASSWDDLKDKPFDKEVFIDYKWDGDVSDLSKYICLAEGMYIMKVGDYLTTEQMVELPNAEIEYKRGEGQLPYMRFYFDGIHEITPTVHFLMFSGNTDGTSSFTTSLINLQEDNCDIGAVFGIEGLIVSEKGLYLMLGEAPLEMTVQKVQKVDTCYVPITPSIKTILDISTITKSAELEMGHKYLIIVRIDDNATTTCNIVDNNGNVIKSIPNASAGKWYYTELYYGDSFQIVDDEYRDNYRWYGSTKDTVYDLSKISLQRSDGNKSYTIFKVIRLY